MRKYLRTLFSGLIILTLLTLGLWLSYPTVIHNLLTVEFVKSVMAENISAVDRQAAMARILAIGEWLPPLTSQDVSSQDKAIQTDSSHGAENFRTCGMIPALIQAQYAFRLRDWPQFLKWIAIAHNSLALPAMQQSVLVAPSATIDSDGTLVIPFEGNDWRLLDNNPEANLRINSAEEVQIEMPNQKEMRDVLSYIWYGDLNVAYAPSVHSEVWLKQGSYLTIETVTAGEAPSRQVHYYKGTDEWVSFDLPLDGNPLKAIYFSLGEPSSFPSDPQNKVVDSYEAFIRAPLLHLSSDLGSCYALTWN